MTKWFELIMSNESSFENTIFPDSIDFYGVDADELKQGKRIDRWNPNSVARSTAVSRDGVAEDIIFADLEMVPVFSPRLRQALDDASVGTKDFQYLPARILQSTGEAIEGFAIANVVTRVAALDRDKCYLLNEDKSEIDLQTNLPKIRSIFTIALRDVPDLLKHDAVRLIEYPSAMLVSERFVEVFHDSGCTGVVFSKLKVSPINYVS